MLQVNDKAPNPTNVHGTIRAYWVVIEGFCFLKATARSSRRMSGLPRSHRNKRIHLPV